MHTRVVRPPKLSPEELDAYLDRGWYRIGQTLMTCRFLVFDGVLRSTIWTRTDLARFAFRRSQRKLLGRLRRDYRVTVGPRVLDPAHEALYTRYRTVARGDRSPTLSYFLFEGEERDVFDTREIAVWRGDQLVAFSWFDVGRHALQSLIGVYEPDLAHESLGYATILLEVEWALAQGLRYHYSGYVLPGEPAMDYKLRVGEMEFLDQDGTWRPWSRFNPDGIPTARVSRALERAEEALVSRGVRAARRLYPMFEAPAYDDAMRRCLDEPLLVECFPAPATPTALVVTWDLEREVYRIVRCVRAAGLVRSHLGEDAPAREVELLVTSERLGLTRDAEALADGVVKLVMDWPRKPR